MRRLRLAKVAVLAAACASLLVIVGCGGSDGSAASPLDNALGYLPKNAPLVASIDTDVKGEQFDAIGKIVDRFPFGDAIRDAVREVFEDQGGDYEEIEPLLGNEFVVGATSLGSLTDSSGDQDFVGAVQAKSKGELERAVGTDEAKKEGETAGATVYTDADGDSFAIKDDVLIVAGSRKRLEAALKQREGDDRLTEEVFDDATADLPRNALLRVGGDLRKLLLDDPTTEEARRIKWVDALRTFGLTVSFAGDEANVGFRLNTDSDGLTERDLPIAAGGDSPSVVDRAGLITVGVRDATQIIDFAEDAARAISPDGFRDYAQARRTIEAQLGVKIEQDLLAQLEGDTSIVISSSGRFGARAAVKDADRLDRALGKLGAVLPAIAESVTGGPVRYAKPKRGQQLYALAPATGRPIVYGVVGNVFVIADDSKLAGRLATADPKSLAGVKGSTVLGADGAQIVQQLLGFGQAGRAGAAFTGPLGELNGSMSADTSGLTGSFRLKFK